MGAQSHAKILLVEDDPGVARLEQLELERVGLLRGHGRQRRPTALERVAAGGIELIVLDQQLAPGRAAWTSSARSRRPATTCRPSW